MDPEELLNRSEEYIKNLLFEKLPKDCRIFLFGSRAAGNQGFASDFDIGLISENLDQKLLNEIQSIIEESFVPFKVDLVDFSKVDREFKEKALKEIIEWK